MCFITSTSHASLIVADVDDKSVQMGEGALFLLVLHLIFLPYLISLFFLSLLASNRVYKLLELVFPNPTLANMIHYKKTENIRQLQWPDEFIKIKFAGYSGSINLIKFIGLY
jgi:hypothetical protein